MNLVVVLILLVIGSVFLLISNNSTEVKFILGCLFGMSIYCIYKSRV